MPIYLSYPNRIGTPPSMKKVSSPTPHTLTPLHASFKLAVHERLYTTKHENFSLRVTASPRPRVHFQARRKLYY
jgi:hypothetical protein